MADEFTAGQPLTAQALNNGTRRCIKRGTRTSTSSNSSSTTPVGIVRVDNVTLQAGRTYEVTMSGHPNGTAADNIRRFVTWAVGSTATAASTVLIGSESFAPISAGAFCWSTRFTCGDAGYPGPGTGSFAAAFNRDTGSGADNMFCSTNRTFQLSVDEVGNESNSGTNL